jgi:hypothetical protein
MKRIASKILLILFVATIIIVTGCEKDPADEADKFVGDYSYIMKLTISGNSMTQNGELTVKKISANKITMTQVDGGTPTSYAVTGNSITENGGQYNDIPVGDGTTTLPFIENSTGSIEGIVITIYGSYTRTGYESPTFRIVCTKK